MMDIYQFLAEHHIEYERFDHPPVYTVEDVHRLAPNLPGAKIKNLFLRDKKGLRHFLVVVPDEKRVDLKALPKILETGHVSFGSPERLKKHLGVEPGSVSLLAIANDSDNAVEVVIDESLWTSEAFQFHPLINTSTLVIPHDSMMCFLRAAGHEVKIAKIEAQQKK
jgi:Ala-tRNA(Pro) deacylase